MTTDTYITRLEDVVKHPEMMPDLSSIRGDIACLLAAHREAMKVINLNFPAAKKQAVNHYDVMEIWKSSLARADELHTYEYAKRE